MDDDGQAVGIIMCSPHPPCGGVGNREPCRCSSTSIAPSSIKSRCLQCELVKGDDVEKKMILNSREPFRLFSIAVRLCTMSVVYFYYSTTDCLRPPWGRGTTALERM